MKPPKLSFDGCKDKREAVEIWLDKFNDWCVLQGWRDTSKPASHHDHWNTDKYAVEISALRFGMPPKVLRNVKSTVVSTMGTDPNDAGADKEYSGYPWVWQNFILSHYSGQDTVLTERITFLDTCKQRLHESAVELRLAANTMGKARCECRHMANPEEELIRDRFVTGIRDDKLHAELLRHKKDDGSVFTLTAVVNRAKAWEATMLTNAKVMEAQSTDEQVHYSSSGATATRLQPVPAWCSSPWRSQSNHGHRRIVATRRRDGRVDIADRRKDTVESSARQASQVWSALTALDAIFLLLCAEVRWISSRKPIKGDVSAPTRANQFTHWIMQFCQRRRTVVMIFITSPWMIQSTLCHQLLLSCSPRYPFQCLAILSRTSGFKWIQLPPATPYHTTTSRGLARMWICHQHLQS